jgi:hypothetical protein
MILVKEVYVHRNSKMRKTFPLIFLCKYNVDSVFRRNCIIFVILEIFCFVNIHVSETLLNI